VTTRIRRPRTGGTGRPPYGYQLAKVKGGAASDTRLAADEVTAPVVRRIFTEYAAGQGLQAIAESLTADDVLCPSAYDRERNPHFGWAGWSKGTVRAILVNERYAGGVYYEPLIDAELFARVQATFARKRTQRSELPQSGERVYRFRGVLRCGYCTRSMQGSWNNGEAYYRCRFPEKYSDVNSIAHPRNVYLRERRLLMPLHHWLAANCPPHYLAGRPAQRNVSVTDVSEPAAQDSDRLQPLIRLVDDEAPSEQARLYQRLYLRLTYISGETSVRAKIVVAPTNTVIRGNISL